MSPLQFNVTYLHNTSNANLQDKRQDYAGQAEDEVDSEIRLQAYTTFLKIITIMKE